MNALGFDDVNLLKPDHAWYDKDSWILKRFTWSWKPFMRRVMNNQCPKSLELLLFIWSMCLRRDKCPVITLPKRVDNSIMWNTWDSMIGRIFLAVYS